LNWTVQNDSQRQNEFNTIAALVVIQEIKMYKRLAYLIMILLFLIAANPVSAASPAGTGKIQGSLINKTAGTTSSVADQTVSLKIFQGATPVDSKNAKSGPDGKFTFEGLPTDSNYVYGINVKYLKADYYSDLIQFNPGETTKSVDIPVYDTTTSGEAISVSLHHAVLSLDKNTLVVKEYLLFANNSDRTFIGQPAAGSGDRGVTLKFSVPTDATEVQNNLGLNAADIIGQGSTFFDTAAVTPDGREISYIYRVPLNADKRTLSWTFNYDTSRFDLLIQDAQIKIISDKLNVEPAMTISGKTYGHYSGINLARGGVLTLQASGLLAGGQSGFSWIWLTVLIPVIVIVWLLIRRRKAKPAVAAPDQDSLLAEIAELDDRYEDKQIDEKEYLGLRQEKKQRLLKLIKEGKG
jgi:hypothetical protein